MQIILIKTIIIKQKQLNNKESSCLTLPRALCYVTNYYRNERFSFPISALNLENWTNNCKGELRPLLISYKQTVHCFNIAFVTIPKYAGFGGPR